MSDDQSEEKTDPASDKKLQKLREDGVIPSSQTGTNFIGFAVGMTVAVFVIRELLNRVYEGFDVAFEAIHTIEATDTGILDYFFIRLHMPILAIFCSVIGASILFKILVHNGVVVSMKLVQPNLDKVNPIKGLKKLVKGLTLTEFVATVVRFSILVGVFVLIGWIWGPTLIKLDLCSPGCVPQVMIEVMRAIVIALVAIIIISIFFDIGIQRAFFLLEQRMTKTEVKREQKEIYGQPEVRQERRRIAHDTANMAGVVGQDAATVYFNYGDNVVAFAFHPEKIPLPKISAKSTDARKSIEIIQDLGRRGIPGIEDEEIVNACVDLPVGSAAPRKIFMPLAGYLRQIFA